MNCNYRYRIEPNEPIEAEYERLDREQRALSRKEQGSQNWHELRRRVARIHARIVRKRRDFLHKLSNYYAREYDLVAVEDLDVHKMMQLPSNSWNRASASWRTFIGFLEYKCDREGTSTGCQTESDNVVETGSPVCSRARSARSHGP